MVELIIRKKRLRRGLIIAFLINLMLLALAYGLSIEFKAGHYDVGYELRADKYLVAVNSSGQVRMNYLRGIGDVKLLLLGGNKTIEIPLANWKDAVEIGGEVLLDVSSSRELVLSGEDILDVLVPRDVRLDLNLTSYTPYHPAMTEMTSSACYHLLYFGVALFNVTVNLCRYPLDPSLVIYNRGDRGLLIQVGLEGPRGASEIKTIEVGPREEKSVNFTGPISLTIERVEVLYGFLRFELRDNVVIARPKDFAPLILAIVNALMAAIIIRNSMGVKRPRKR